MSPDELRAAAALLDRMAEINAEQHPGETLARKQLDIGAASARHLADVIELHTSSFGSQGYLPGGRYGWIDNVCPECGHADEYGIASPCPTLRIARGETTEKENP